jgi:hypothetical protein
MQTTQDVDQTSMWPPSGTLQETDHARYCLLKPVMACLDGCWAHVMSLTALTTHPWCSRRYLCAVGRVHWKLLVAARRHVCIVLHLLSGTRNNPGCLVFVTCAGHAPTGEHHGGGHWTHQQPGLLCHGVNITDGQPWLGGGWGNCGGCLQAALLTQCSWQAEEAAK